MQRRSAFLLVAPALLMLCFLYAKAGMSRPPANATPIHPMLRHDDGLYYGCAVDGPLYLPEGRVPACELDEPFSEADIGERMGTVAPDASAAPEHPLLPEHGANHVPPGTALFTSKQAKPGQRLLAQTPQGWFVFLRHPISNARTLGDALLWATQPGDLGRLFVDSVALTSLADRRKRTFVGARPDVDALVIATLAAPVDWRLAPAGEAYDLAFVRPKGGAIHMSYFPETGLLVVRLALLFGTVGVPFYAPADLRTRFDGLIRAAG